MILVVPATYVCIKPFLFILYSLVVSIRTILNLCAKGVNHNEVTEPIDRVKEIGQIFCILMQNLSREIMPNVVHQVEVAYMYHYY